jgi:hypothetical protein
MLAFPPPAAAPAAPAAAGPAAVDVWAHPTAQQLAAMPVERIAEVWTDGNFLHVHYASASLNFVLRHLLAGTPPDTAAAAAQAWTRSVSNVAMQRQLRLQQTNTTKPLQGVWAGGVADRNVAVFIAGMELLSTAHVTRRDGNVYLHLLADCVNTTKPAKWTLPADGQQPAVVVCVCSCFREELEAQFEAWGGKRGSASGPANRLKVAVEAHEGAPAPGGASGSGPPSAPPPSAPPPSAPPLLAPPADVHAFAATFTSSAERASALLAAGDVKGFMRAVVNDLSPAGMLQRSAKDGVMSCASCFHACAVHVCSLFF